ncbi:MAG: flagellar export protein FliJ [Treponema sp.]|uniref:flagellar export protein FliJ n=1 Tax=Treponema sp. TaxID=166 RepID=UPI00298E230B|nr:flagellar export protein FliJ [Treponema sp.]MCQ2599770.1 flagellar export protein FliJ [Treponema sp.]
MKKFKFELEDVLSLRKFQQEQAQIELGKAVAEEVKIQDNLNLLALQHAEAKKSLSGSTDFAAITNGQSYFSFLKMQEEKLLEDLAAAKIFTETKREAFKEALQKTESISKLKEQQLAEYKELEAKEEEDTIDDMVTARFGK